VRDRRLLLGSLTVVVAASGFGLLGPLARFAYDAGFDPLSFVAWRATFGLLCVLLVIWARTRRGVGFVDRGGCRRPTRSASSRSPRRRSA
jgi:drug/metabolite transporter (DMT)-like permease